jgi:hypothetical protein
MTVNPGSVLPRENYGEHAMTAHIDGDICFGLQIPHYFSGYSPFILLQNLDGQDRRSDISGEIQKNWPNGSMASKNFPHEPNRVCI